MMNDNEFESKFLCGLLSNSFQLVLSHLSMRLVFNSLDLASILNWSDYAPEINHRASRADIALRRHKGRFGH
jgi:hypothetical protein